MRVGETPKERNDRIVRETYQEWFMRTKRTATFLEQSLRGYYLDDLETAILETIRDKLESGVEDYTVSVTEMNQIFGRDLQNIRDTMKGMERKGIIKMVEYRKTRNKQMEKRYAETQSYEDMMADIERERIGTVQ